MSVNFFGSIALVRGLRDAMANAAGAAVVLLASNSITCQPGWHHPVAGACLAEDETAARRAAAEVEAVHVYPASKAALAWWARREGVTEEWAGAGIRLNAVAPGLIATPMTDRLREDPELGVFADAYPTALNRPGLPRGGRGDDRLPALRRRQPDRRLGAVRRRRHRRDDAPHAPGADVLTLPDGPTQPRHRDPQRSTARPSGSANRSE